MAMRFDTGPAECRWSNLRIGLTRKPGAARFDMAISVEREGGPVWLMLRGNQGVKQFIWSEFKLSEK